MNERIFYSEYFYQKGSKDTGVLEKNAREYPYSSLAAFLLLYHYKKIGHQDFEKLANKTALLFNNEHWLQFQLCEPAFPDPAQEINGRKDVQEEKDAAVEVKNEVPLEIPVLQNVTEDSVEVKEDTTSHIQSHETVIETDKIVAERFPEENAETETEMKENSGDTAIENSLQQHEFTGMETGATEDEIIPFEPLHTVDYFASQGIKINETLLTNDKLGNQMKSFTAWLRSMKKLHPGKLEEQSLATEKLIQTAADESNINTEILTEAMAEVLIKQDKKEKAIEMFSKLSLINPSKSAYFAARIESIKSN